MPEKFLGLGDKVYGFLGELSKRISFKKFLRISQEYFSGNSGEVLWTSSQNFQVLFFSNRCL